MEITQEMFDKAMNSYHRQTAKAIEELKSLVKSADEYETRLIELAFNEEPFRSHIASALDQEFPNPEDDIITFSNTLVNLIRYHIRDDGGVRFCLKRVAEVKEHGILKSTKQFAECFDELTFSEKDEERLKELDAKYGRQYYLPRFITTVGKDNEPLNGDGDTAKQLYRKYVLWRHLEQLDAEETSRIFEELKQNQ